VIGERLYSLSRSLEYIWLRVGSTLGHYVVHSSEYTYVLTYEGLSRKLYDDLDRKWQSIIGRLLVYGKNLMSHPPRTFLPSSVIINLRNIIYAGERRIVGVGEHVNYILP
jgi:hypothetical protein